MHAFTKLKAKDDTRIHALEFLGMKENEEIEISLRTVKKIVILQCTKFPIEEFFKRVELIAKSSPQPVGLSWAEGIVFLSFPYQPGSDIIIEDALKGTIYLGGVFFSQMPKYQPLKKMGAREIPIINQSAVLYLKRVAQWLKNR